jgi:hypothetical protein
MSETPPSDERPGPELKTKSNDWPSRIKRAVPQILVFLMILGSVLHEHEADLSSISAENQRFGTAVQQYQTWNLVDEIYSRVESCNYSFLFVCTPSPRACLQKIEFPGSNPVCLQFEGPDTSKLGGWPSMIVHLPDALLYLLVQRWQRGPLEFTLALLFVAGVITGIVAAARNGLAYIPMAVVIAPLGMALAFWIAQQMLSIFSVGVGYLLALGLSGAALAASMHYLSLGHDLHSLAEAGRKVVKDET